MIGHINKFIFIHIPKTGGTSIEHVLFAAENRKIPLCSKSSLEYNLNNTNFKDKHSKYVDELTKDEFKSYFKFTFVRNPWDLEVSSFFFVKFLNRIDKNCTLEEYITSRDRFSCIPFFKGWVNPICCDFFGKFENLQQDFNLICGRIKIPIQILPHTNKIKRNHYTVYYSKKTQNLVAEKYAREIEYFSYRFGD